MHKWNSTARVILAPLLPMSVGHFIFGASVICGARHDIIVVNPLVVAAISRKEVQCRVARAIAWSKPWSKPWLETRSKSSTCANTCAIMEQAHICAHTHRYRFVV